MKSTSSTPAYLSRKYLYPEPSDSLPFSLMQACIFLGLCDQILPGYMFFILCCVALFAFAISCAVWFQTSRARPNCTSVFISTPQPDKVNIELGGLYHQDEWFENAARSCLSSTRSQIFYNNREIKVVMRVHLNECLGLREFRRYLDCLISEPDANVRAVPHLDLEIEIPAAPKGKVGKPFNLGLERFTHLRKLTWRGPFVEYAFNAPGDLSNCKFSRLQELRLVDCVIKPETLVDILKVCPHLASLEVEQCGVPKVIETHPSASKRLLDFVIEPKTLQRVFAACPRIVPLTVCPPGGCKAPRYSNDTTSPIPPSAQPSTLHHHNLRHLRLSSSTSLQGFFKNIDLPALETLSLRLAPSLPAMEEISKLAAPWQTLAHFELQAPLDDYALYYLQKFFLAEQTYWGRRHTFIDDRRPWAVGGDS